jgi:hypothetical protein
VDLDPDELAAQLLTGDIDAQPADLQPLLRYIWARAALDFGILLLVGEEHVAGRDRLICTLQEDGSCYVVERPPGWGLVEEAKYVGRFKELLGGTGL